MKAYSTNIACTPSRSPWVSARISAGRAAAGVPSATKSFKCAEFQHREVERQQQTDESVTESAEPPRSEMHARIGRRALRNYAELHVV